MVLARVRTGLSVVRFLADIALVLLVVVVVVKLATEDDGSESPPPTLAPVPRRATVLMTNSIGMRLVQIPGGEFIMGSQAYSRETAPHSVRLGSDFWMGRCEVTQAEYQSIMGSNPSRHVGETLPVEQVSWTDALEFCRRLGEREQRSYRLPTEAEWEYACRAGTRTAFCFGDDDTRLGEFAWYDASSGRRAHPVGTRKTNAWGLHDLHGNVWEWCLDRYAEDFYAGSPSRDPVGPADGEFRVMRGGAWYNRPVFCRSGRRDFNLPDYREDGIGFRVVLAPPR